MSDGEAPPKQKLLRTQEQPTDRKDGEGIVPAMSTIDPDFDHLDEADAEFVRWRWPVVRDDA